jgi:hypothetical protein
MNKSDEMKFAEIMATIGAAFFKPLTSTQLDIYFDCLQEYPIEDLIYAAKWILKNRTITGTFPLIAEFVQAIQNRNGTPDERAELAWRTLIKTIENHGYYQTVQFEDAAISETVKALGGWMRISGDDHDWTEDNLKWRRKEFMNLYNHFSKQKVKSEKLLGYIESMNLGEFDAFVPETIFIGVEGTPLQIERKELKQIEDIQH